jgi:hypothetical protein
MRSLAHELATQRTSTQPRHESSSEAPAWTEPERLSEPLSQPSGPTRRAVLRRALRQGLLRPATRLRVPR